MYFQFTCKGDRLVLLSCPKIESSYKKMVLHIYCSTSWNILTKHESKDSHIIATCYNASIAELETGIEFIWPTMFQVNFWNLETGMERSALKSVIVSFCCCCSGCCSGCCLFICFSM